MEQEFNFAEIKNKALEQLKSGKSLLGKDGAFAPLLENILNATQEGEMDSHLDEEDRNSGNRRNGKMHKQLQISLGGGYNIYSPGPSIHLRAPIYQEARNYLS